MTAPLVFLDTETTGLDRIRDRVWEVYAIRRQPDGQEYDLHLHVHHTQAAANRLPEKYRRDHEARYNPQAAVTPWRAGEALYSLLQPASDGQRAHLVGLNPDFDAAMILPLIRAAGLTPEWHYHTIDVANMALGYLAAEGIPVHPPYETNHLAWRLGVDADDSTRHTAKGDVAFTRDLYDRIVGGETS